MQNQNQIEILNDLVKINNDRIEGYRKATEQLAQPDAQLTSLFENLQEQSQQYNQELSQQINMLGGNLETGTTAGGKIYRTWMDVKSAFGGNDPKAVLKSCEGGENAAHTAYQNAIESHELNQQCAQIVSRQSQEHEQAMQQIQNLRAHFENH